MIASQHVDSTLSYRAGSTGKKLSAYTKLVKRRDLQRVDNIHWRTSYRSYRSYRGPIFPPVRNHDLQNYDYESQTITNGDQVYMDALIHLWWWTAIIIVRFTAASVGGGRG